MTTVKKHDYSKNAYQVFFNNALEQGYFCDKLREYYNIDTAGGEMFTIILLFNHKATPAECRAFFNDTRLYRDGKRPVWQ